MDALQVVGAAVDDAVVEPQLGLRGQIRPRTPDNG